MVPLTIVIGSSPYSRPFADVSAVDDPVLSPSQQAVPALLLRTIFEMRQDREAHPRI
jgi:hypothetical protein